MLKVGRAGVAVGVLGLLMGCRDALAPVRPAGAVSLEPWGHSAPADEVLVPWAQASGLTDRQRQALNEVRSSRERVFSSAPPNAVLDEIELIFFGDGATFELAGYYREAVDAQGAASALRPRLAWLYHWLGMTDPALQQANLAVEALPQDPQAWFIRGFVMARYAGASAGQLAQARLDLERALALDPLFVGPGGINAQEVRDEISAVSQRMPAAP